MTQANNGPNNENLVDLRLRTSEERKMIARAGGLVRSDAKRMANLTKGLKHGRYAKSVTKTVEELAGDPARSALKIYALLDRLDETSETLPPKLQMDLIRLMCDAHRTVHGVKSTSVNITTQLKADLEAWYVEGPQ